jgi:phytoene dehydrogenase-like protein
MSLDAIVVGSGPNGLSAALLLARAGLKVRIVERNATIGGGTLTEELTIPGFRHDVCSSIHPMALASPFFRSLGLAVEWGESEFVVAQPFDDGRAAVMRRSVQETAASFGGDAQAYERLIDPFVRNAAALFPEVLRRIRPLTPHPFLMARFGLVGLRSSDAIASRFEGREARALFAGCAAHGVVPLDSAATAAFGIMLIASGHAYGWPAARGGSVRISDALEKHLRLLDVEIETGHEVRALAELPPSRVVLLDLTPRQIVNVAGDELPPRYVRRLQSFRYGPGVFKIDWALDGPVPWRNEECRRSATVHLGGPYEEVAQWESDVARGKVGERPFLIFTQPTMVDPTRAPAGKEVAWAYAHVPNGWEGDLTDAMERQVERFAPGFRDLILGRNVMRPRDIEAHNPNMIGGDIGGGANDVVQFLARPVLKRDPYATPNERLFICSSSTPPGGGVHGMCGYWAARSVLRRLGIRYEEQSRR